MIELLVALFIFSLVVTIAFSSFKEIAFSARMVDEVGDDYQMLNGCLSRMTSDLESLYIMQRPGYAEPEFNDDPDIYRFTAESESVGNVYFPLLRFTSRAHLGINRAGGDGVAEIVYYADEDDDGSFLLRRSDSITLDNEFKKSSLDPVLCKNLRSLTFKYYDEEGEAHDDWDSESDITGYATPSRIDIRIETGSEEKSVVFATGLQLPGVRVKKEER